MSLNLGDVLMARKKVHHRVVIEGFIDKLVYLKNTKDVYKALVYENLKDSYPELPLDYDSLTYNPKTQEWHIKFKYNDLTYVRVLIDDAYTVNLFMDAKKPITKTAVITALLEQYPDNNYDPNTFYYNPVIKMYYVETTLETNDLNTQKEE